MRFLRFCYQTFSAVRNPSRLAIGWFSLDSIDRGPVACLVLGLLDLLGALWNLSWGGGFASQLPWILTGLVFLGLALVGTGSQRLARRAALLGVALAALTLVPVGVALAEGGDRPSHQLGRLLELALRAYMGTSLLLAWMTLRDHDLRRAWAEAEPRGVAGGYVAGSLYHDHSQASDALPLSLSGSKLRRLEPHPTPAFPDELLEEHLCFGDTRAAVVVSTSPLHVAAYSDELDCVALLSFPEALTERYQLVKGSRLLTVNAYFDDGVLAPDLAPGPASLGRYTNFHPLVAEFLSDDLELIERRKRAISTEEWRCARELGERYLAEHGGRARRGQPYSSMLPAPDHRGLTAPGGESPTELRGDAAGEGRTSHGT